MKHLHLAGLDLQTTDDLADATLRYAFELGQRGSSDVVEIPGVVDGQFARCTLLLSGAGVMATVAPARGRPDSLDGADEACADIKRRLGDLWPAVTP